MHNNEFEHKVQQQMEEFKLTPSDAVWQQVQAGIMRGKRRRMWKYVPVAAALLLLLTGYFVFMDDKKNDQQTGKDQTAITNNTQAEQQPALNDKSSETGEKSSNSGKEILSQNDESITNKLQNQSNTKNNPDENNSTNKNQLSTEKPANNLFDKSQHIIPANKNKGSEKVVPNSKNTGRKNNDDNAKPSPDNTIQPDNTIGTAINDDKNNSINLPGTDLKNANVESVAINNFPVHITAPDIKISNEAIIRPAKKRSQWQWGIQVTPGISDVIQTSANFEKSYIAMMNYAGGLYNRGNSYEIPNSDAEKSMAFSGGLFVQRKFGKLTIDAGVNYNYYSSSLNVGGKVDSTAVVRLQSMNLLAANVFYNKGSDYTYRNKYHFIEIPVTVGFPLFSTGNTKINASVGASYAYLLSGKMIFNNSYGNYFEANSLLNRSQIFLNAGFGVLLNEKAQFPVTIGPVVTYGASRVANSLTSANHHIISLGLKTSVGLQKLTFGNAKKK